MKMTIMTRNPKLITILPINKTTTQTKATYVTSTTTNVDTEQDDLLILTWTQRAGKSWIWFRTEEGLYAFL